LNPKELARLAGLKAAKQIHEIAEATAREQESKVAEFASKGKLQSGGTIKVIMDLALQRMDGIIRAQYEAFKEVSKSGGLLTNALLREYGQIQALQYASRLVLQAIHSSPARDGLPADLVEKLVSTEVGRLKVSFLRDVQIDAVNMDTKGIDTQVTTTVASRKKWDVFVSFATIDQGVGEIAMERLREQGLRVFSSPKDLQSDEEWPDVLRVALVTSGELCLIVSRASLPREWVRTEWSAAWATAKRITPVLVDLEAMDLPARLKSKQCIGAHDLPTYAAQTAERILGKRRTT